MNNLGHGTWFVNPAIFAEPQLRRSDEDFAPAKQRDQKPRPIDGNHLADRFAENPISPEYDRSGGSDQQPVILIPFDATMESLAGVKAAIAIAAKSGARLVLFHAVHLNLTPYGPVNPSWLRAALRQEAVMMVEPLMHFAQSLGVSVICVVEEGAPAVAINRAAKKWVADVIVLTAHQRGWLGKWFERRALDRVIRAAECPVMVLDANRGQN
jgi:nucleotide-binding universal stress UspA family protein